MRVEPDMKTWNNERKLLNRLNRSKQPKIKAAIFQPVLLRGGTGRGAGEISGGGPEGWNGGKLLSISA